MSKPEQFRQQVGNYTVSVEYDATIRVLVVSIYDKSGEIIERIEIDDEDEDEDYDDPFRGIL